MKSPRLLASGIALALATGLATQVANATLLSLEDDDFEFHLREVDGTLVPADDNQILWGDVLFSVVDFPDANSQSVSDGNVFPGYTEMTGITAIQSVEDGDENDLNYTFLPYAGLNDYINSLIGVNPNLPVGTTIALWLDDVDELQIRGDDVIAGTVSCGDIVTCVDQAVGDVFFEADGFADGDTWDAFATTGNPIEIRDNTSVASIAGFFNASLTVLDPGVSLATLGDTVTFSGTFNGAGGDLGEWVQTDFRDQLFADGMVATSDAQLIKTVPTPTPLALLAAGLMGLGIARRRRA